jgi:ATP phosphoribosyltransferase regulatory subunit HisZ
MGLAGLAPSSIDAAIRAAMFEATLRSPFWCDALELEEECLKGAVSALDKTETSRVGRAERAYTRNAVAAGVKSPAEGPHRLDGRLAELDRFEELARLAADIGLCACAARQGCTRGQMMAA